MMNLNHKIMKNNIEITDLHRKYYRRYYTKRKTGMLLGYHEKNEKVLQILKELELLKYIRFVYKKLETDVRKHSEKVIENTYFYFVSTGKKMPNKKLPTKPVSRIYDEDDTEINLILRKVELEYAWDDNITINGKESDVYKTQFNNYYITFEDRMYKVVNDRDFSYSKGQAFWTLPELKRVRAEKIKELFPEF